MTWKSLEREVRTISNQKQTKGFPVKWGQATALTLLWSWQKFGCSICKYIYIMWTTQELENADANKDSKISRTNRCAMSVCNAQFALSFLLPWARLDKSGCWLRKSPGNKKNLYLQHFTTTNPCLQPQDKSVATKARVKQWQQTIGCAIVSEWWWGGMEERTAGPDAWCSLNSTCVVWGWRFSRAA